MRRLAVAGWRPRLGCVRGPRRSAARRAGVAGKLAKAHAELEGISNCQKCHEQGQKVTRAEVPGVPRAGRRAHGEEGRRARGRDERLRDLSRRARRRRRRAAPVRQCGVRSRDGRPASRSTASTRPVAIQCAACHKTRSFLTLTSSCASCHADVHKGTLGANCASCHSTQTAFKELSGAVRSREGALPAGRRAQDGRLRELPREQGVQGRQVRVVHRLPSRSARAEVRRDLHVVPHERHLADAARVDHATHGVPARRHATRRSTARRATSSRR